MRLVRDTGLFSKDAVFEGAEGPIDFDAGHSYTGTILGECVNFLFFLFSSRIHSSSLLNRVSH